MQLKDLLDLYEGTIDVFVILESARRIELVINAELGQRANKVYFQPRSSHSDKDRQQKVDGQYSPERPAVIFDVAWMNGTSFEETLGFLHTNGYSENRVYGYYAGGEMHPDREGPYHAKHVFDTAENIRRKMSE